MFTPTLLLSHTIIYVHKFIISDVDQSKRTASNEIKPIKSIGAKDGGTAN